MANQRGFAWLDESVEHTDRDCARAQALADKWSELHNAEENRLFQLQFMEEGGRSYDPSEDCECEYCIKANHDCDGEGDDCTICSMKIELTECESVKSFNEDREARRAERELEVELVEDKLQRIGARIMRPYEHWNEEERLIEYAERER